MNPPKIKIDPKYNPFKEEEKKEEKRIPSRPSQSEIIDSSAFSRSLHSRKGSAEQDEIEQSFSSETNKQPEVEIKSKDEAQQEFTIEGEKTAKTSAYQLHNKYILAHIKTGMIVIDQQAAHERILFENFLEMVEKHKGISQQQLFPQTLEFSAGDTVILKELNEELQSL